VRQVVVASTNGFMAQGAGRARGYRHRGDRGHDRRLLREGRLDVASTVLYRFCQGMTVATDAGLQDMKRELIAKPR
jgi:hypothetical protein